MATPRKPGIEAVFTDRGDDDEIPYIKVRSQRNADGTHVHVWEKWVAFNVEKRKMARIPASVVEEFKEFLDTISPEDFED